MPTDTTLLNLIRRHFGEEDASTIEHKHRGGSNNSKGSDYEIQYAVFQLANLAKAYLNSGADATLSSQILAFVDDLAIETLSADGKISIANVQLKNVNQLSWGKLNEPQTLANDFLKQKKLNDIQKMKTVSIRLVVSDNALASKMEAQMPADISAYSHVVHFPSIPLKDEVHIANLKAICPWADIDKLEAVHANLLSAWMHSDKQGKVSALVKTASNFSPSYISPTTGRELPTKFVETLARIPDFTWQIDKGFFSWSFNDGLDTGYFNQHIFSEKFDKFITWVIDKEPATFDDIEGALL